MRAVVHAIAGLASALALGVSLPALAGSGPWTLARGDQSLYVGVDAQRLDQFAAGTDSLDLDNLIDVDEGIATFTAKGIVSFGLTDRVELELAIPWSTVFAFRTDGPVCTTLGQRACDATEGLGLIDFRAKGLLLDELYGDPVTLAVAADARFGHFTRATRQRLTNRGEGTFDLGGSVLIGRSGGLGAEGYWSTYLDVGLLYRFPLADDWPLPDGGLTIPGWELSTDLEAFFAPNRVWALGPSVNLNWRPYGIDFGDLLSGEAPLADPDRFAALRILNLSVGAKVLIRGGDRVTFSASVFRSVYTIHNPLVLTVSAGITVRGFLPREED